MEFTVASLARYAAITREILAHCAGLRAIGFSYLAERIERGDLRPQASRDHADVIEGLRSLRNAIERMDRLAMNDAFADVSTAFSRIASGADNSATYAAARLEVSRAWVAVDDAIEAMRNGR